MNERPTAGVRVPLTEIALAFNRVAVASFGGGLSAWSREMVVVRKQWMSDEQFLSAMTMCRIMPGANQINLAVFVGSSFAAAPVPSPPWSDCASCR